jgi:hypothetical protein
MRYPDGTVRMQRIRHLFTISAVSAMVACDAADRAPTVAIEWFPIAADRARGESFAALESGHHEIRVRRMITVPECHTLSGNIVRTGNLVVLRVIAREADTSPCRPVASYLVYTATIRELNPGRYDLRVIHAHGSERRPREVVLEHPIVVLERSVQVR